MDPQRSNDPTVFYSVNCMMLTYLCCFVNRYVLFVYVSLFKNVIFLGGPLSLSSVHSGKVPDHVLVLVNTVTVYTVSQKLKLMFVHLCTYYHIFSYFQVFKSSLLLS